MSVIARLTARLRALALSPEQRILLRRAARRDGAQARRVLFESLLRRVGRAPAPLAQETAAIPVLSAATPEDRAILAALVARGALPRTRAVIVMGDAPAARLDAIVAALDAQSLRVADILVHARPGAPARAAAEALAAARADAATAGAGEAAPGQGQGEGQGEAALLIPASVSLRPEAVAVFVAQMRASDAALVYADACFPGDDAAAFHKPAYSPRLAASGYMGGCALVALDAADPAALASLVAAAAAAADPAAFVAQRAASLDPRRVAHAPFAVVEESDPARRVLPPAPPAPVARRGRAAIIIPTRDRLSLLRPCIESILARTATPRGDYDIVVVDNGSVEAATLAYLQDGARLGKFSVIRDDGGFNYARLNNVAARAATAEALVFLNNDTLIIQPDWLERLTDAALDPRIGVVGAKLLYEDGSIQHGGVILGVQGVVGHADAHLPAASPGYRGLARRDREISAVTGACMATARARFFEVGGFDEKLAVAFNDVVLCAAMLEAGYVNLQLNSVRVVHLESKSRGADDTPEKKKKFFDECLYARARMNKYFLNDIYYNPNLSLQDPYAPAKLPRRRKPWRAPLFREAPRVLILSCTHQRGHGVPVVIAQHVAALLRRGFDVHVGGPQAPGDLVYPGATRAALSDPFEACAYAAAHDVDMILPHTPPFFSVARWAGPYPIVAPCDYGEPPPELFPDAGERRRILAEKIFSLALSHRRYAISPSVKAETGFADMVVAPLGNSNMAQWSDDKAALRARTRARLGWDNRVVVLNVCRFHAAERRYKGVDQFVAVAQAARRAAAPGAPELVFAQCGKATPEDVAAVARTGVACLANVTDEEMAEIYCAADVYANFSQWEGWNLGIAQALAYGLPVVASDIAAHRINFDVFTTADADVAAREIARLGAQVAAAGFAPPRKALVHDWDERLTPYVDDLLKLWREW